MADPNQYDLLNQIQYFVQDPSSPLMQQVRKELAPLEQRAGKFKEGSPEFKKLNQEYQRKAAASLLTKIQEKFGGAIPDRKTVEEQDFQRRSAEVGADPEQLKQDSLQMPYQRGYNILEQLQKIAGTPATPASITPPAKPPAAAPAQMPGAPAPRPAPAPAPMPSRQPGAKPPANDDEMLNETQLAVLYGLAKQANGGEKPDPNSYDELDATPSPRPQPERTTQDATPEQMQMEAYKKAFLGHQTGDAATYAHTPLPPGWARSPQGLPITAPDQAQSGQSQEDVMEQIRRNIARMMAQEKMGE